MNGVDLANQLRSTYGISRKASKWWKYVFWFLVDVAICSSFILMKDSPNHQLRTGTRKAKHRTQLGFRQKLAHQLLGAYQEKKNVR